MGEGQQTLVMFAKARNINSQFIKDIEAGNTP